MMMCVRCMRVVFIEQERKMMMCALYVRSLQDCLPGSLHAIRLCVYIFARST